MASTLRSCREWLGALYRLPEERTFAASAERAPAGFVCAVKASRFLTHMKKLKSPEEPIERLFTRLRPLDARLGPVLYQLPPGWPLDLPRLEHFLQALPKGVRHVMEFRHTSWYADEVMGLLERFSVALCLHDMEGSATGRERVGPFIYVRFHGAGGNMAAATPTIGWRDGLTGWGRNAQRGWMYTRISTTTSAGMLRGTRRRCGA